MYLNRKTYKLEYCYCCLKDGGCLKDEGCLKDGRCLKCPTAAAAKQPNVKAQLQTAAAAEQPNVKSLIRIAAAAATELQSVKTQLQNKINEVDKLNAIISKMDHV